MQSNLTDRDAHAGIVILGDLLLQHGVFMHKWPMHGCVVVAVLQCDLHVPEVGTPMPDQCARVTLRHLWLALVVR